MKQPLTYNLSHTTYHPLNILITANGSTVYLAPGAVVKVEKAK